MKNKIKVKELVRKNYGNIAIQGSSCCPGSSCCSSNSAIDISKNIGYSAKEIKAAPEGANLGLGCGNPVALASLKKGETVLDLGAGAGFDAFLSAKKVGKAGKVIGVDMTPEMVARARKNAEKGGYSNVEFRLGEIEHLPVDDDSIDIIISNCVINLSPDKPDVFKEAFRVLKRGGRLMVSDLVLAKELPDRIKKSFEAYCGCVGGAAKKQDYLRYISKAGFRKIEILSETPYVADNVPEHCVLSVKIKAVKP